MFLLYDRYNILIINFKVKFFTSSSQSFSFQICEVGGLVIPPQ
jgi:hypothetical protein